jgi:hypothetical protein
MVLLKKNTRAQQLFDRPVVRICRDLYSSQPVLNRVNRNASTVESFLLPIFQIGGREIHLNLGCFAHAADFPDVRAL